ncbi:SspB family protein [Polycladidibacter stylochi]|uniref:SspB family protein n=1 Tax=Polycladidibacter stylochi TaxID=1807766 RepID=UPI0008330D5B|nr:ClpXP protease specificity-enhancing factor SspB [Pseudovibrio stylochi]
MAEDEMRYDIIIQDALRGAVRKILNEVLRTGLPGEHHFYIAFETTAPGVKISNRLKERYPQEMTIVLQHQFWDLQVNEHSFEVGLSFGGVPERLFVPFAAIKGFFDPSVQFALEFEPGKTAEDIPEEFRSHDAKAKAVENIQSHIDGLEAAFSHAPSTEEKEEKPQTSQLAAVQTIEPASAPEPETAQVSPSQSDEETITSSEQSDDSEHNTETEETSEISSAQVVSLDAFRKKT